MNTNPMFFGIDVGSQENVTARWTETGYAKVHAFANNLAGHKRLIAYIKEHLAGRTVVQVGLEATGPYSISLALALVKEPGIEVSIINPRIIKNFIRAKGDRGKTDRIDAIGILNYLRFKPFRRWNPPNDNILSVRSIGRRIYQLKTERVREENRLATAEAEGKAGKSAAHDIKLSIKQIDKRLADLYDKALAIISGDPLLSRKHQLLTSINGIANKSSVHLLGELLSVPPDLKGPQIVAYAGLDPRVRQSGCSIDGHRYISKAGNRYIRAAMYMPTLVAIKTDPFVRARFKYMVDIRHKEKMIAVIAMMRKLLLCIHGMFSSDTVFNGALFSKAPLPEISSNAA